MTIQPRVSRRGPARAGWSRTVASVLTSGVLLFGAGILLATTAVPVAASAVTCGTTRSTTPLAPGASGRCLFRFAESAKQAQHQRFTVTLEVDTTATSGGGSGNTASEAPLDGRATGLHVVVSDSERDTFGGGTPSCNGAYPNATPCSSAALDQAVHGGIDVAHWSDTFTMSWWLPRSAGNPYQGGSATMTVTAHFNGITGAPASPSPSPTSGVLAASTPSTGVGSIPMLSLVLIGAGIGLLALAFTRMMRTSRPRRPVP